MHAELFQAAYNALQFLNRAPVLRAALEHLGIALTGVMFACALRRLLNHV